MALFYEAYLFQQFHEYDSIFSILQNNITLKTKKHPVRQPVFENREIVLQSFSNRNLQRILNFQS